MPQDFKEEATKRLKGMAVSEGATQRGTEQAPLPDEFAGTEEEAPPAGGQEITVDATQFPALANAAPGSEVTLTGRVTSGDGSTLNISIEDASGADGFGGEEDAAAAAPAPDLFQSTARRGIANA